MDCGFTHFIDHCFLPCILNREDHIHFLVPPNLSPALLAATQNVLAPATLPPAPSTSSPIKWESVSSSKFDPTSTAPILSLHLPPSSGLPKQVIWHKRGDYLASVCESFCQSHTYCRFERANSLSIQLGPSKELSGYTRSPDDTLRRLSERSRVPYS